MKKLNAYKDKAKWTTIGTAAFGIVMCVSYCIAIAQAQSNYYETIGSFSSLTSYAAEKLSTATSEASLLLLIGIAFISVACISAFMWALSNLLIAYKSRDEEE